MDTKQLEYILAIARAGTIGRAAKQTGLTQQALSKSLARLEQHYGGKIFHRSSKGMTLTRLGKVVCEHAADVLASYGRLQTAVAGELDLERGRLVVGLSPVAASGAAGRIVTEFALQNPKLRIDIEGGIDADFSRALNLGQIDLAIATNSDQSETDHLSEIIGHETWGVCGRKAHPVLSRARSVTDLRPARWIIGRNTEMLRDAIDSTFLAQNTPMPRPGIMTTSLFYALSALRDSDQLAILPKSLCAENPNIIWKDLSGGQWTTPLYLLRRRQAHMPPLARALF